MRTTAGDSVVRWASEILQSGAICDECLGRAFGKLGRGLTNEARGQALRTLGTMLGSSGKSGECWVCGDAFLKVEEMASRAAEAVQGFEFATYLFGVVLTPRLAEMEALFAERFPTGHIEPVKHAFNRAVGRAFDRRFDGVTVDFSHPHVRFDIDLSDDSMRLHVDSIYMYGRYRKLVRGIPQTRWPCRRCRGSGCPACHGSGKQYPESVEELIGRPFQEAAGGHGVHLHGAGREDIDALMLGTGRPFVLEVEGPHRRTLDLESLRVTANADAQGKAEIVSIQETTKATVALVKETKAQKRYRAVVQFGDPIDEAALHRAVSGLIGTVHQRTPQRVSHRRADLVRERNLYDASGRIAGTDRAVVEFLAEGGLYIKELVSGDDGRTTPNLAQEAGSTAWVTELDVMDVRSSRFPDAECGTVDIS